MSNEPSVVSYSSGIFYFSFKIIRYSYSFLFDFLITYAATPLRIIDTLLGFLITYRATRLRILKSKNLDDGKIFRERTIWSSNQGW